MLAAMLCQLIRFAAAMPRSAALLLALLACLADVGSILARAPDGPRKRSSDEVLVVYNDQSLVSKTVAADYADKRGVKNSVAVHCNDSAADVRNETISLADYRRTIETPVRTFLGDHPQIQFIVLTKGIPIRIRGAITGERPENSPIDTPLNASVDSTLAAMDYQDSPQALKIRITGSGATGMGLANRYWNAKRPFTHSEFGGYLVTRLDGYTEADAKALVSRALAAEKGLEHGNVLLDVQPTFGLGDKRNAPAWIVGTVIHRESDWSDYNADMLLAHDVLAARGIADELDLSEKFIGHRSGLLGYFSWGSNDARFDSAAYQSLRFAPGSICDTAVSTSGRTFLPTHGGQSLLVDLLAHGLTCGKGYTDEPLLQAIASPSIVMERYTAGYTMAESFYAASHFVGWQDVVIGDPLCCPYPAHAAH
jgi:uncharacterized protein (TIGR03790 family)